MLPVDGKGKKGSRGRRKDRRSKGKSKHPDALNRIPRFAVTAHRTEEVKTADYSQTALTLADVGNVTLLNGTIQGLDAINDRIGRKILVKRVTVRGTAGNTLTSLTTSTGYENAGNTIRFLIVFDKQTDGATPTYGTGTTGLMNINGNFNAPFAFRAQSTLDRFIVLADMTRQVSAGGPNSVFFELDAPCLLEVAYNSGNAGDVTDIVTGGIFLMVVDTNSTANLPGNYSYTSRVEFTDA